MTMPEINQADLRNRQLPTPRARRVVTRIAVLTLVLATLAFESQLFAPPAAAEPPPGPGGVSGGLLT